MRANDASSVCVEQPQVEPSTFSNPHLITPARGGPALSVSGVSMGAFTSMSRRTQLEWDSLEDRLAKRAERIAQMTVSIRVPPQLINEVEDLRKKVAQAREELARYNRELVQLGEDPVA